MTLTEEQREAIGFDLERARGLRDFLQDDCAEVGDVWGEMIAEIERLRADLADSEKRNEDLRKCVDDLSTTIFSGDQAARIKELETAYLKAQNSNLIRKQWCERKDKEIELHVTEIERLRARVVALEDALVEERARATVYCLLLHDIFENEQLYETSVKFWPGDAPEYLDGEINERAVSKWLKKAHQQLKEEGEIGPDATKPRSWQITEERMRAIRMAEELAWDCKAVAVLRAMLQEAGL